VDRLSDLGFPVERVAIIGDDLRMVEQVTGRLNYGGAAVKGALSGALPGALIGWIFGLFNLINPLVASMMLAFYGLIIGAVIGAVMGLVGHALQGSTDVTVGSRTVAVGSCSWSSGEWWAEAAAGEVGYGDECVGAVVAVGASGE
jgi:hypothetical protein